MILFVTAAQGIAATMFSVTSLVLVRPAFPQQSPGAIVSGHVVSAKDQRPLTHAKVTLLRQQSGDTVATVNAAEDGSFAFPAVPAGRFRLVGFASGFLPSAYQGHEGFSTAIVTGAGLATDGLRLELMPASSIEGRLRDESGEPIRNGNLILYRETMSGAEHVNRMRSQQTNDNGEYEFADLPAGRYYLSANATPWYAVHPRPEPSGNMPYRQAVDPSLDVTYPLLFYPNALESREASPIVLHNGDQFLADMQMQPTHALTITLRAPAREPSTPGRPALIRYSQLTRTVFGAEEPVMQGMETDGNGVQRITGVAPGEYHLHEMQPNGGRSQKSESVHLTTESVMVDRSSPAALSTLQATVHTAGGRPLPTGFQLQLIGRYTGLITGKADPQGVVKLSDVPEGDYQIRAISSGRGLPVIRLTLNGHTVPQRQVQVTGEGGTLPVEITLADGTANVEGVALRDGKPAAGSMVVLVPAGDDTSDELFRRDQSDLDGGFLFRNVVPGNYLLVAIEDGWPLRMTDTNALQRYLLHAMPVTVTPTQSKSMKLSEPVIVQQR